MRTHSHHRIAAIVLALGLCLVQGTPRVIGSGAPGSDYRAALEIARTRGVPMVVIVTARDVSVSLRLWDEFQDGPWARTHRGLVLVVQVCREGEPQLVRTWNITRFPTAIVFSPDANGMTALGSTSDCAGGAALAAWLDALDSGGKAPGELDPSVRTTAIGTDAYPSQQQPPPPSAPPAAPPTYSPPTAPAYAAPLATTSAGIIQVPSQNYVIQQAPPQIFMAPAQAPIVYVPQAMTAAMMPVAPAPPANVFLPAAPAPVAPMAAAMPVAAAFAPAPVMTAAPAAAMPAAITNQTLALPASQTATRVRVRGPGLFAASLSRFGERLVQLGQARIVTTQETVLQPPYPQTASGLTTISTTSAAPIAPPQAPAAPPQPPAAPPPPPPQPSPQNNSPRKHFLFPNQ